MKNSPPPLHIFSPPPAAAAVSHSRVKGNYFFLLATLALQSRHLRSALQLSSAASTPRGGGTTGARNAVNGRDIVAVLPAEQRAAGSGESGAAQHHPRHPRRGPPAAAELRLRRNRKMSPATAAGHCGQRNPDDVADVTEQLPAPRTTAGRQQQQQQQQKQQ